MIELCNEETFEFPRQPDWSSFFMHCTGGYRASLFDEERHLWVIEPILEAARPCRKGYLSQTQLAEFFRKASVTAIAFQRVGWSEGRYYSWLTPIVSGRNNHSLGPADVWRSISANLSRSRLGTAPFQDASMDLDEMTVLLDDMTVEERLAESISLSLRNLSISVEQIAGHYNELLVDLLTNRAHEGTRHSDTRDQTLFAHVQSFFIHLGTARDFLGALLAARTGKSKKIDSMGKFIGCLTAEDIKADRLVGILECKGYIQRDSSTGKNWKGAGWLKEVTDLRNTFVHDRAYGSRFAEKSGRLVSISRPDGLYKYFRPILVDAEPDKDLLDLIAKHFRCAATLFKDMAEASGYNAAPVHLTEKDIISVKKAQGVKEPRAHNT